MDHDAAAEADDTQHQRDGEADLVKDRIDQQATGRSEDRQEHGGGDAMDDAEA